MSVTGFLQRSNAIVGMNYRNRMFIDRLNPRSMFRLVDDKLIAKERLAQQGLPCPETLAVIRTPADIRALDSKLPPDRDCVVKPAKGGRGRGILILRQEAGQWFLQSGKRISLKEIQKHVRLILCGEFSLGNHEDQAFCEEKLTAVACLDAIYGKGVPDLRIILHQGQVVMAMLRVPTRDSQGRANLHQGGVGIGIELDTGVTNYAIGRGRSVERHPDTDVPLRGITVPHWEEVLSISRKCYEVIALGYVGVDIILDEKKGPVVVELNARPGLSIQLANRLGLRSAVKCLHSLSGDD